MKTCLSLACIINTKNLRMCLSVCPLCVDWLPSVTSLSTGSASVVFDIKIRTVCESVTRQRVLIRCCTKGGSRIVFFFENDSMNFD